MKNKKDIRKLIVFGGAFNPPTLAHIRAAKNALEYVKADGLIFVPVGNNYVKNELIESRYRVDMLKFCCDENMDVDLTEIESDIVLHTIETLSIIKGKYANSEIYFLCGADNLNSLTAWDRWEQLLSRYKLMVMSRDDLKVADILDSNSELCGYANNILEVPFSMPNSISSTIVRELIKNESNELCEYVPECVRKYICSNNLYIGG